MVTVELDSLMYFGAFVIAHNLIQYEVGILAVPAHSKKTQIKLFR